ncbi:MAG: polyprenyl synthetase family protein [bacterium]
MSELDDYLTRQRGRVDAALAAEFPLDTAPPHRLLEAVRYSLLNGGKRLRPILALAACEAVGGAAEAALPAACALEMIHAYSLVHDDLPAMDDDAMRRGRATTHVAFGEGVAILAGDALLTEAFALLSRRALQAARPRPLLRVLAELAEAAGARGMVGGQAADLAAAGAPADMATVEFIHVRKTGALLLASVRSGAHLGGASAAALRRLSHYGECLGLAFQIADDVLDAEGAIAATGKAAGGRDRALDKATYPAVLGLPAAKARARELRDHALAAVERFPAAADPLRAIASYVVERAVGA